jgi:hypothetical protein
MSKIRLDRILQPLLHSHTLYDTIEIEIVLLEDLNER